MKKILLSSFIALFFGITAITTVHSEAGLREHFLHLSMLGSISIIFICYVLKDSIKIKNRFNILTLLLLFGFGSIRLFPCHMLTSNPQDIAHANAISHPCVSVTTSAAEAISIIPTIDKLTLVEQKPFNVLFTLFINPLRDKSPPFLSA